MQNRIRRRQALRGKTGSKTASVVVTCNCVRNPGGHAESSPRPSEEGVSIYLVVRPLDLCQWLVPLEAFLGHAMHGIFTTLINKVKS